MNNTYADAFAEVIEVLRHSKQDIIDKIPDSFIRFLTDNMNKSYKVSINFNDEEWDNSIKQETQAILALIYRDYIVTQEEREKLIAEEEEELLKHKQKLEEQYNIDNLFKKRQIAQNEINNKDIQLMEIQDDYPWYKKIFHKLLKILGIRN